MDDVMCFVYVVITVELARSCHQAKQAQIVRRFLRHDSPPHQTVTRFHDNYLMLSDRDNNPGTR